MFPTIYCVRKKTSTLNMIDSFVSS